MTAALDYLAAAAIATALAAALVAGWSDDRGDAPAPSVFSTGNKGATP